MRRSCKIYDLNSLLFSWLTQCFSRIARSHEIVLRLFDYVDRNSVQGEHHHTRHQSKDLSQRLSFFQSYTNLQNHDLKYVLLHSQYRQAVDLSKVFNKVFYDDQIVDGEGMQIKKRSKAMEVEFIKNNHHKTIIASTCFTISNDTCDKETFLYDSNNIAAIIKIIHKKLKANI